MHSHPLNTVFTLPLLKKKRSLLIKSINHTGGVGSRVHPLARVSNQSSSLVMHSREVYEKTCLTVVHGGKIY